MSDLPPPTKPHRVMCTCGAEPRRHMLEQGIKLLADKVRAHGWTNRRQESNGELVGRALWDLLAERDQLLQRVAQLEAQKTS